MRARFAVAALLLAIGLSLLAGTPVAQAATPDLTLVTAATYDVEPAAGRVGVTARITATNHLHDSTTKRFFFTTAYLAVLPGTSAFKLTAPGAKSSVTVATKTAGYTLLKLNFGTQLASGKSLLLTLRFDVRDAGGAPDRAVRISPSIVSFTAWAFATAGTSGSSVTVRFPVGYTVVVGRGPLTGPLKDSTGRSVWTTGPLSSPLTFIADVSADRPGDYSSRDLTLTVGKTSATVTLRSWPDDTAWRDRVGDLVTRGLPALGNMIGLDWPITGSLVVQEALVRNTGGYAGLFDPTAGRIQISYTASSGVVLHEATHAWFNGHLVADRWAAEAFASYYADLAATALKVKIASPTLTDALKASAIPLNAWGAVGTTSTSSEAYAYAASLAFARAAAARAGDKLQTIWARAAAREGGYQPPSGTETVAGAPDWRGLLDLFDATTGTSFDDLWRQWIARPEDKVLLDARTAARTAYAKAVADAGPWALPRSIRDAMRAWQFDVATQQMTAAEAVLTQRTQLQTAANDARVTLPATLQGLFEGNGGVPVAAAEATAERSTIEAIQEAAAAEPAATAAAPSLLVSVGLLGSDPGARLADARKAFAAGQLNQAISEASDAAATWTSAGSIGRTRVVSAGLLVFASLLLARILWVRRRRPAVSPAPDPAA
ncbi:MAG TPA: hypothetical protein VGQ85_02890 [Candidatus Limnocylindrales bacterium]|nr:hypothetical protein [Candidatus Limnocylindrales bacterium]